jgi:ankyrin repeat protein
MSLTKLSKEEYSFLQILENLDSKDIKNMCLTNKRFYNICDEYLNQIYKKLILRDFNVNVPNNKVFQILYDLVNGIKQKNKLDVYMISFLFKNIDIMDYYNRNNIDEIIKVLQFTKNANIQDKNGKTPLILSVFFDNKNLFEKVLKYKPDVNIKDKSGMSVLSHSLLKFENQNLDLEFFKQILSLNVNLTEKNIHEAIKRLNVENFKLFIKKYKEEMKQYNLLYYFFFNYNKI